MRYAVLSDVHANLPALRAVLDAVPRHTVDGYLVTGDLVGYGAHPNECVELLASYDALCVAGNHDLIAVGSLPDARAGGLARETLAWTRSVLTEASRGYLSGLPNVREVGPILLAHGSPDDPQEYVTEPRRARELLDATPGRLLLLGHTHHAWAVGRRAGTVLRRRTRSVRIDPDDRYLLNAGSVGQSRDRSLAARFAVLDLTAGTVAFRAVAYDVAACRTALIGAGLPATTYQLLPTWAERREELVDRVRERLR